MPFYECCRGARKIWFSHEVGAGEKQKNIYISQKHTSDRQTQRVVVRKLRENGKKDENLLPSINLIMIGGGDDHFEHGNARSSLSNLTLI